jgi:MerR family transcriptional regulator, light-induced transcriptional regulator
MPSETRLALRETAPYQAGELGLSNRPLDGPSLPAWRDWQALQLASEAAADRRYAAVIAQALHATVNDMVLPALVAVQKTSGARGQARGLQALQPFQLSADDIAAFTTLLTTAEDGTLDSILLFWRQQGLTLEALLIEGLQCAAQLLGRWWEQDQCDFAAVTVGTARLHRLMRWAIGSLYATQRPVVGARAQSRRPRIWMGVAHNEQHRFGLSMAAELFRLAGWDVLGLHEPGALRQVKDVNAELLKHSLRAPLDAVGLSVGGEKQQEWARCVVDNLRCNVKLSSHLVLLGGPLVSRRPEVVSEWGADLLCARGELAPLQVQRRLAGKG